MFMCTIRGESIKLAIQPINGVSLKIIKINSSTFFLVFPLFLFYCFRQMFFSVTLLTIPECGITSRKPVFAQILLHRATSHEGLGYFFVLVAAKHISLLILFLFFSHLEPYKTLRKLYFFKDLKY